MLPSSDDLEGLHARVREAVAVLKKLGAAEVTKTETKELLAGIAREWLKLSPLLRAAQHSALRLRKVASDISATRSESVIAGQLPQRT